MNDDAEPVLDGFTASNSRLSGVAASNFDLGRGAPLGGNTISGHATSGYYNLTVDVAPAAAPAGSTNPLPGQYAVQSGTARDVTGAVTGQNHTIRGGANVATTTIRLAETP